MKRSTSIIIGTIVALTMFVFLVIQSDNYLATTTILVQSNNEITALQAEHVINNIAQLPQQSVFLQTVSTQLLASTDPRWNEHIQVARTPGAGFISMSIRATSTKEANTVSTAITDLWIKEVKQYYDIPKDVQIRVTEYSVQQGSWRDFALMISFSLLIAILLVLVIILVIRTLQQHKKESNQKPTPIPQKKEDFSKEDSEESTIATPILEQKETQPTYLEPTFSTISELDKSKSESISVDEDDARSRLQHARAQERTFQAATAKEITNIPDDNIDDLFDTYAQGEQHIGKRDFVATTGSAPSNLPISEPTVHFGIPDDAKVIDDHSEDIPEYTHTEQTKKPVKATKNDSQTSVPKNTSMQEQGTQTSTTQENVQEKKVDTHDSVRESNVERSSQSNGVPMNLPIVGLTGKMTAAEIQEEVRSEESLRQSSDKNNPENIESPDLDREPTDEELKLRLNQLLQGNFKTKK